MRKFRSTGNIWTVLILASFIAGCGLVPKTTRGKVQKAGQIMIAMDGVMKTECESSWERRDTLTGEWATLSEDLCLKADLAYRAGFAAWEGALSALEIDGKAAIGTYLTVITRYVMLVADIFKGADLKLPGFITDYVDEIAGAILGGK